MRRRSDSKWSDAKRDRLVILSETLDSRSTSLLVQLDVSNRSVPNSATLYVKICLKQVKCLKTFYFLGDESYFEICLLLTRNKTNFLVRF